MLMPAASRHIPVPVRNAVQHRAGYACEDCRAGYPVLLTFHHKVAFKDGGEHTPENLELLCRDCHGGRHSKRQRYAGPRRTSLLSYPPVLTPEDCAEYLNLDPGTVREAIDKGTLPGVRVGRRAYRIPRLSLEVWERRLAGEGAGRAAGREGTP
jgi:excisionase family DNA binding protein